MSFFRRIEPLNNDTQNDTLLDLDIDRRVSTRAKRLSLKVNFSSGRIELVIPKRASQKMVDRFLIENRNWVKEKQIELPKAVPFSDGLSIPIFGNNVTIEIRKDNNIKRTTLKFEEDVLIVKTNLDDPSPRIKRYLKKVALEKFKELSEIKSQQIDKTVNSVSVRDTKSRWGSCSHEGSLSLSWRLIFAPYEAMDYVIAHEVAHLKHMNHSKQFWNTCESICDDYKSGKSWMKANGHTLMRYGLN